jgi:hypothetical protein
MAPYFLTLQLKETDSNDTDLYCTLDTGFAVSMVKL